MLYRDFIPRELAPGWLLTPKNAAWLRAAGICCARRMCRCWRCLIPMGWEQVGPEDEGVDSGFGSVEPGSDR